MDFLKVKNTITKPFAAGGLALAFLPLLADGKNFIPITVPDVPTEGNTHVYLQPAYSLQVSAVSGSTRADLRELN